MKIGRRCFLIIYKTAQIAKLAGVHPNTIRFYEEMELLPVIPRNSSGYRIFNDRHLMQLCLLRAAFRAEIISSRLRQEAVEIVKEAASDELEEAYLNTRIYLEHLKQEKEKAEEAISITLDIIEAGNSCDSGNGEVILYGRKEAAGLLGITIDVLRDWERNGLLEVPRNHSGYRSYGRNEMNRLKIIRILRNANYSMMSILRMFNRLDAGEKDIRETINTPGADEDIVCAADRYITALGLAEEDALKMLAILEDMKKEQKIADRYT